MMEEILSEQQKPKQQRHIKNLYKNSNDAYDQTSTSDPTRSRQTSNLSDFRPHPRQQYQQPEEEVEVDKSGYDYWNEPLQVKQMSPKMQQQQQQKNKSIDQIPLEYPKYEKIISEKIKFQSGNSKILSGRFDPVDNYVAFGCEDGNIRIFQQNKSEQVFNLSNQEKHNVVTNVRWRPFQSTSAIKNILLSSDISGNVIHWHVTSGKILKSIKEQENAVYALDFNFDGSKFATGGQDTKVRVYDENKISHVQMMTGGYRIADHANRVFAAKFVKNDPNLLITAGWDQYMLVWDLRIAEPVICFYGPLICGDSLDYKDNLILSGSFRDENQIQLWDLRKSQICNQQINWFDYEEQKSHIYSCRFSQVSSQIIAGSTGANQIRVFDAKQNYQCTDIYRDVAQGVLTLDVSPDHNIISYGCGEGLCGLLEIK